MVGEYQLREVRAYQNLLTVSIGALTPVDSNTGGTKDFKEFATPVDGGQENLEVIDSALEGLGSNCWQERVLVPLDSC